MSPEPTAGPLAIKYQDLADYLRANPGKTLLVRNAPTLNSAWATAQAIKTGRRAAFRPAGDFHAHTNGHDVYATYTGGQA